MSASLDKSQLPPAPSPSANEMPKPYLRADGTLVIPFGSDPKYHYWKPGGQKIVKTVEELKSAEG